MHVHSPFVCLAGSMSYQSFLELCATDLPLVRELTEIAFQRVMDVLEMGLAAHVADVVWMGGCEWLTPPMGSPALYDELVQPYERAIIERIHAGGALSWVHCHGKVRSTLEKAIARGTDYFEPVEPPPDGDITFAEAKAVTAGRMTLGGNVEVRILQHGSVEQTEQAVRAAFEGPRDRMVLQPSEGPLSRMSKQMRDNYHRLIDVWEELSSLGELK